MNLPAADQDSANMWKLIAYIYLIFSIYLFVFENTGQITDVTMGRIKKISCFISNILHFFV